MKIYSSILPILFILVNITSAQPGNFACIWHTTGGTDSSRLGFSLTSAGDVNMDGYDDILAMAYKEGVVYLYFGGNPMDTIPDMSFTEEHPFTLSWGWLPKECRDLNGDGYNDIAIGGGDMSMISVFVYFGGSLLDSEPDLVFHPESNQFGNNYGHYISMGDFNGDGYYDLVLGNDNFNVDNGTGIIYVYYGGPDMDTICDWSVTGEFNNIRLLGANLSCGGDLNGDGCDDILCRGYYPGIYQGIMAFFGGANPDTLPDWVKGEAGDFYSGSLNIIPDINDDGCAEIAYASNFSCNGCLHYGGNTISIDPDVILTGTGSPHLNTNSGYAGDLNDDGYGDFIVGSYDGEEICIYLLGPDLPAQKHYDARIQGEFFSSHVMCTAGDVDADGIDDFMFNAMQWDVLSPGQVFIYSDTSLSFVKPYADMPITTFTLEPCYPNPFNSATTINFTLNKTLPVKLMIYDISGRMVGAQNLASLLPGQHQFLWNAEGCASGVYFVRLSLDGGRSSAGKTQKVVLLK